MLSTAAARVAVKRSARSSGMMLALYASFGKSFAAHRHDTDSDGIAVFVQYK